jgi:ECF sigma factor
MDPTQGAPGGSPSLESPQGGLVTDAIKRFRNGDDDAFDELWRTYFDRLAALAGRRFNFAQDGEDAALTAFKTFHRRAKLGAFPKLDDSNDVWVVLKMLLWQKVSDMRRKALAKRRGGDRRILNESELTNAIGGGFDALPRDSNSDDSKETEELMSFLKSKISDSKTIKILELKEQASKDGDDLSNEEIARRLDIGVASVYRKLKHAKEIWESVQSVL